MASASPDGPAPAASDSPLPDRAAQLAMIGRSRYFHRRWYLDQNPEIEALGLEPEAHFLDYGAFLGRNPGKTFETRFYLAAHPEVQDSGLNPLVHYELSGRARGLRFRAQARTGASQLTALRRRFHVLGFTQPVLDDLAALADGEDDPDLRAGALLELALIHLSGIPPEDPETALACLSRARRLTGDAPLLRRIAQVGMLGHECKGDRAAGLAAHEAAALAGHCGPEAPLLRANLAPCPQERLAWINTLWSATGLATATIGPGEEDRAALDRLGWEAPPRDAAPGATPASPGLPGTRVSVLVPVGPATGGTGPGSRTGIGPEIGAGLEAGLRSLAAQTWADLEILLLDQGIGQGIGEDSAGILRRMAGRDPRLRLLPCGEETSLAGALNRGLAAAGGAFVTTHRPGDLEHPQRIARQMAALAGQDGALAVTVSRLWLRADLRVSGWDETGALCTPAPETLLLRRDLLCGEFGGWDRILCGSAADLEVRLVTRHGPGAVCRAGGAAPLVLGRWQGPPGPQRPLLAEPGLKACFDLAARHRRRSGDVRVPVESARSGSGSRPFPVPARLDPDRKTASLPHFPVIIGSEFRMPGGSVKSCIEEIRFNRQHGLKTGLFELYRYDLFDKGLKLSMLDEVLDEIDGTGTEILSPGDEVSCDLLLLRYPPVLWHDQRHLPKIRARAVKVIVNQPPMSDYGPGGVLRYDIAACAANVRRWFGTEAVWHPIGPLVREALTTRHAEALHHIDLSPQDWHNIIDIAGWERGAAGPEAPPARTRGPGDRLRIGRHARDHALKWPAEAETLRAVYPDGGPDGGGPNGDVEVHVLGGAKVAAGLLGGLPANWVVHDYGSLHPRDFLRGIDVWVYFANPGWVESFGRTIIEAMAAGVPVILPEQYRPLFGKAALYATPQTALDIARRLHADPAERARQTALARALVRDRFSHAAHAERLRALGVAT
ncbi:MAG: glycosyltransferase [Pseudorhodobacter sp.]